STAERGQGEKKREVRVGVTAHVERLTTGSIVPFAGYTDSSDGSRRTAAPLGPRTHRRGARPYPRAARPGTEPVRARGLLAALVRALRLQTLEATALPVALRGAAGPPGTGRERRGRGSRRGRGGRVQGRKPQSPLRGRTLPGRGHRRRRH